MDLSAYVRGAEDKIVVSELIALSSSSLIPIRTLKDLANNPSRPCRYLNALRLVRASQGKITLAALREQGPLIGERLYDGPLGEKLAVIATTGDTMAMRLVRAGIRANYLAEILSRKVMPRRDAIERMLIAFDNQISADDFHRHHAWITAREQVEQQAAVI